ncbi:MAG: sensor histidine kinase [Bacteroidales bacterium]|jgi:two-component system phosphate regulon sensor histidine kinase PhoR|nr:sensor histidine kinase [Bacteroidales bacterium]
MRFGSIIRTAIYIALSGSALMTALLYLPAYWEPHSRRVEVILILLYAVVTVAAVIIFLRRFLFQHFDSLFRLVDGGRLTGKELEMLSGKKDVLSNIKKNLMEWSSDKASEIDRLKEMERYRKEFLGNVSHELKTPIFNIQGYILTLLDGGLEDPSVNRLYLERSEKSINRMIHIVEDLESIARLESGELLLDIEPFDMLRLVDEVFEMEERTAEEARIKLEVERKQVGVNADRKRIMEVMNNLVVNSIKYGRKNGTTTVSFAEKDNLWWISVTDNGIGIAEKDRKRIFERFYRCDKSRSREQGGTGLGLAIVKHIVEAHGQTVTVQSAVGQWTAFTFSLPKSR